MEFAKIKTFDLSYNWVNGIDLVTKNNTTNRVVLGESEYCRSFFAQHEALRRNSLTGNAKVLTW